MLQGQKVPLRAGSSLGTLQAEGLHMATSSTPGLHDLSLASRSRLPFPSTTLMSFYLKKEALLHLGAWILRPKIHRLIRIQSGHSTMKQHHVASQTGDPQLALFNSFHQVLQACIDDLELMSIRKKRLPPQRSANRTNSKLKSRTHNDFPRFYGSAKLHQINSHN